MGSVSVPESLWIQDQFQGEYVLNNNHSMNSTIINNLLLIWHNNNVVGQALPVPLVSLDVQ